MVSALEKNQSYVLTITSLGGNGNGVAHEEASGMVVFVPNTACGDVVKARIIKVTKNYAVGKIEEIIKKSSDRCDSCCTVSQKCGGCTFQHISYEAECRLKNQMINDCLSHIGGLNLQTEKFIPDNQVIRYRNKAIYPIVMGNQGKLIAGFYASLSHRVVEHNDCLLGPEIFCKIKDEVLRLLNDYHVSAYNEINQEGLVRGLYLRINHKNEVQCTLIINGKSLKNHIEVDIAQHLMNSFKEIQGFYLNTNTINGNAVLGDHWKLISGKEYLEDSLLGKTFQISPASFFQVNHDQCEVLYRQASEYAQLKDNEVLFDLFCGTGTIGIAIANSSTKVIGVEIEPDAIKNAKQNSQLNHIQANYYCLPTDLALEKDLINEKPDVIIIDPPRKGCGSDACKKIADFGAKRIVYISCNPSTLARDLCDFQKYGYIALKATGVDMFPRTGHVETVVLMSRKKSK